MPDTHWLHRQTKNNFVGWIILDIFHFLQARSKPVPLKLQSIYCGHRENGFWSRITWVQIPAPQLPSCMSLGMSVFSSERWRQCWYHSHFNELICLNMKRDWCLNVTCSTSDRHFISKPWLSLFFLPSKGKSCPSDFEFLLGLCCLIPGYLYKDFGWELHGLPTRIKFLSL